MTEEQWRTAWILCETASDLNSEGQREYVQGATVDREVERHVAAVFEALEDEPYYPPPPDRRVGDTVGRYRLLARIGQGGMGEVYSAEDTELRRTIALKFLPSAVAADTPGALQLIREARLASQLNHPNIVTVYELIQTPWGLGIAMELVEGQSLRTLRKSRQLPAREIIQIGRQIASALAAAHQKGIVHRDVKPENIMVRVDGYVKVLDFGLAQNIRDRAVGGTGAHLPVGTVRYMAPEQKQGGPVTGASDVYSLALVLEELGAWRHPLLAGIRNAAPEDRPSAAEVFARLERLEKGTPWPMLALGLIALAVLSTVLLLRFSNRAHPSREPRLEQITRQASGHDVTVAGLSSEGDSLAYTTGDGGLFVRSNRTSVVKEVDAPADLSISQLFFESDRTLLAVGLRNRVFEAWTVPLDGSKARLLRSGTHLLALSHDRKRMAWLNERQEVWTAALDGTFAQLVLTNNPDEKIGMIFWSANDKSLWFNRLRKCYQGSNEQGGFVYPDTCEESDLASYNTAGRTWTTRVKDLRFDSGVFVDDGEFFFLREDVDRKSEAFNLWSLQTDKETGNLVSPARQLSHLNGAILSQLTASQDGSKLFVVRTESSTQTEVADWQNSHTPSLRNLRRLTLDQTSSYPHAWTPDSRSVIFESDRNGRLEVFGQNLTRKEADLLVTTPGDVYMPVVTPDGQWLLMMYRNRLNAGQPDNPLLHRLLRAPISGGPAVEVPLGEPLDEFRCSLPGQGTGCVLRTTETDGQRYFELDPVKGKGRELGGTRFKVSGLGGWSLSPDGRQLVIPDARCTGCFREIGLSSKPGQRTELQRRVKGIGMVSGIEFAPSGRGWQVRTTTPSPAIRMVVFLISLRHASHVDRLYYVDAQRKAHLFYQSDHNAYGLLSPDEKHIALLRAELASNVWSFQRDSSR